MIRALSDRSQSAGRGASEALRTARPSLEESVMASKLFIGNLPRTATDSALSDFVTAAGFQVASAVVIRDRATGEVKGLVLSSWPRVRISNAPSAASMASSWKTGGLM